MGLPQKGQAKLTRQPKGSEEFPMNNAAALTINVIAKPLRTDYSLRRVIVASSVGTLSEWYDFFIFGSRAVTI